MKRVMLIIIIAIFTIFVAFAAFFVFALRPIDRTGFINTAQNNINSQIAKAVGRSEASRFSNLLEFIQYPGVKQYGLERDKNFDHDWRSIHFQTEDSFDKVLTFYQGKFPQNNPYVETRSTSAVSGEPIKPFRTAQFRVQTEPGKIRRSFLFFTIQDRGLFFRIDITELTQDNLTSVALTSSP